MTGFLRFLLRRRLAREPAMSLLTVAGVALGTGSVVTVQVLTRGAVAAFDATVELLGGDADVVVLGHGGKLDESLYPVVLETAGIASASPLIEASVLVRPAGAQQPRHRVPLYGMDLLAPQGIPANGRLPARADSLLAPPAAISTQLADALSLRPGDFLKAARGREWTTVVVSRVLDADSAASNRGPMLVLDIADAQDVLGGARWISRINVRLRPEASADEVSERLASRLDGRALLSSPSGQRTEARRLLSAFRVNLSALAATSVFVGLFLVYGTTRASLSRRRDETGALRSLGATRGQVLGAVLAEAGVLGVAGAALGVLLGYAVALAGLDSVSGTVANLYLLAAIRAVEVPADVWVLALAGGFGGTVAGAAGPAVELCTAPVAELLSERRARLRWRSVATTLSRCGWAMLAFLLTWFAAGGHRWRPAGFVLAAGIMAWTAMSAPGLVSVACRLAGRSRGFGARFALGGLSLRLHTSGVAVAGVAVAFAMLVGTTVMIGSFRDTFQAWLDATMRADVYVSSAAWTGATDQGSVDGDLIDRLRELPGVAALDPLRGFHGYADDMPVTLRGTNFRPDSVADGFVSDRFLFMKGDPEAVRPAVAAGAVVIGEPLARRAGVWQGDSISVRTVSGAVRAEVAGVYYDYSSDRGSLSMDLSTMEAWFGPGGPHGVAVHLDPKRRDGAAGGAGGDENADAVEAVRQAAAPYPVLVRSNGALRNEALRIFDHTFAVTLLLQAMAMAVAAAGVALSLLVMAREEASDTATCRALGATRAQLFRFHMGKGAGLAGLGALLGAVGGGGLAVVLIYVTNRAYFGWTVQFGVPVVSLLQQCAALALATVAASWWPALRASSGGGTTARRTALATLAALALAVSASCSPDPTSDSLEAEGNDLLPLPVAASSGWLVADPGYRWSFPHDHGPHFGYKTEWWYFTGVLSANSSDAGVASAAPASADDASPAAPASADDAVPGSGSSAVPRALGYQFTIFKVGLVPPRSGSDPAAAAGAPVGAPQDSRWAASSLLLGHAAVSDPAAGVHVFSEVLHRAGFLDSPGVGSASALASAARPLLAGFGLGSAADGSPIAWSRGPPGTPSPWRLAFRESGFALDAADDAAGLALSLVVQPTRPVLLQGPNGYSRKSSQPGRASMYYSRPRLATVGTVQVGSVEYAVTGTSWMDHEFSSEPLAPEQVGWDWLSLRLDVGLDVTAFQLRRSDGEPDYRAATLSTGSDSVPPRRPELREWSMTPGRTWTSPATGATYPVEWTLTLPEPVGRLIVRAAFPSQENLSSRVANLHYWEGMVRAFAIDGTRIGEGYLEMTGYGKGSRPAL